MTITAVYAEALVANVEAAERWYSTLFDAAPDLRPMEGLLTWLFVEGRGGVQVWRDPERAGRSAMTLGVSDLDTWAARLSSAGITHGGPQPGGGARLVALQDPDGNQVVLVGA